MKKFIKGNWQKFFGVVVLIIVVASVYFYYPKNSTPEEKLVNENLQKQTGTIQAKIDFFNKYNLYYFDNARNFVKNGEKIEKGGDKFTPDFLYSDGSFLSSYNEVLDKVGKQGSLEDVLNSSVSKNDYKLFFQGNVYESSDYSESVLRDKNFIYYKKCLKVEYNKEGKGNRCVNTALYSNNDKIDEGGRPSDIYISTEVSNIDLKFIKNGILYYGKTIGEKYEFYSYDPISKRVALYNSELFSNNENELLGIFDNGDIVFGNSIGIFKNNFQSKIIDMTQLEYPFALGEAIGNSYYYFNNRNYDKQNERWRLDLNKDNLLVAKINNDTYGRMIDSDKQDCHFGNYISGYPTLMYCINKYGTIVRLDEKANAIIDNSTLGQDGVVYIVNNDVIDFYPYWTKDGSGEENIKNINSASFIFDEKGNVSSLVIDAFDKEYISNIYLAPYLGDGKIGKLQMLVSNASLFGVIKK